MGDTRGEIRAYITERLAPAVGRATVGDDEDLIESGVVDSLGIFQLIAFLEERFGVKIGDEEITPEHFGTIAAIDQLVASRAR
jgi:acyl carrier protein